MKMFYLVGKTFSVNYRYFDQRVAKGLLLYLICHIRKIRETNFIIFYVSFATDCRISSLRQADEYERRHLFAVLINAYYKDDH